MKLEVLVYSDSAPHRFVFINGRKFTEGQRVDEGVVLERIQADSAVLSYQGQKFLLRE
ncbi:MAG TPA: general secretion pathway protein GspB [Methylomirabilota bacterium]|nr:general secretion pathway protein GspB [Methylomirabilota bacterium]